MIHFHLNIVGYLMLFLALLHGIFPKYFSWQQELKKLELINKQLMEVHTFFIALTVALMGLLCILTSPEELSNPLGKRVMSGFAFFWFIRLLVQFIWYSPNLWKGKTFESLAHYSFAFLWIYFTYVFTRLTLS